MIDVKVSNNKLYDRSIRIVSNLSGLPEEVARLCLLRSIYRKDTLDDSILNAPISNHISIGFKVEKVVPVALLLATGKFNIETAIKALEKEPIVRKLITNVLSS
jgi:hypothetical protein